MQTSGENRENFSPREVIASIDAFPDAILAIELLAVQLFANKSLHSNARMK